MELKPPSDTAQTPASIIKRKKKKKIPKSRNYRISKLFWNLKKTWIDRERREKGISAPWVSNTSDMSEWLICLRLHALHGDVCSMRCDIGRGPDMWTTPIWTADTLVRVGGFLCGDTTAVAVG